MKTAVIYARVSSENDRQNTNRQVEDLKDYASNSQMSVVEVFCEQISGAKKNEERMVLLQCLEFCKTHEVEFLLISELSRLGRSTLQVLKSLELLHTNGTSVYIQNLSLFTLTDKKEVNPIASILVTVLAELASIERTNIAYRLNSGRNRYIANGGKLGRRKGSVKTKEQKREEYKEVISLLKRGYSIRNTARITNYSTSTVQRLKKEFSI